MTSRRYHSPGRTEAAEQTRARIVAAAGELLSTTGVHGFSLESVGKAAGVTRLTVYNQLGSRRALLEAVFDERAARGGLHRIAAAMANDDAHTAIRRVIEIFCDFWGSDREALASLHDACSGDVEFADSLRARHERRRRLLTQLVRRLVERGAVRAKNATDLIDFLFVLTSIQVYTQLTAGKRSKKAACAMIQAAAEDAVRRAAPLT
jgi:AcrR family transcriptional regulator